MCVDFQVHVNQILIDMYFYELDSAEKKYRSKKL